MPPALVALAPVVASVVSGAVKRRGARGAEQKAIDFERQQDQAKQVANRARFEADQNSPGAAQQRLGFNTRLSRILGSFGGRDQTPEFITRALDSARGRQEFVPGAEFIDRPVTTRGGLGGFAEDAVNAASYFDVQGFKRARAEKKAKDGGGDQTPPAAGGFKANLPSFIRGQDFALGPPGAAEEDFLSQKQRPVTGRA